MIIGLLFTRIKEGSNGLVIFSGGSGSIITNDGIISVFSSVFLSGLVHNIQA
jgi:hypothetical protein